MIKKTCKELGLTYRELGEKIGLTEASIKRLASSDEINLQVEKSLQMLLKINELESELQDFRTIKRLLLK
ncbi:XRE family transcriptional regulator [Helicobacter muridarum]|uniref:XRE family transcriptional regulator n=1 Tax=Helicobacter muridarum TaxID=216 RepID=A0A4U8TML9_9HELI|nr:XRE family transcriptional regulator [Helicobacter muridarum]